MHFLSSCPDPLVSIAFGIFLLCCPICVCCCLSVEIVSRKCGPLEQEDFDRLLDRTFAVPGEFVYSCRMFCQEAFSSWLYVKL
jgi:hypothetical protein